MDLGQMFVDIMNIDSWKKHYTSAAYFDLSQSEFLSSGSWSMFSEGIIEPFRIMYACVSLLRLLEQRTTNLVA